MTKIIYTLCIFATLSFTACGQSKAKQDTEETKQSSTKNNKMDTSKLTNETVKKAFVAWQNGDSKTFLSYFTDDAKLFDDGNSRDFSKFVKDFVIHKGFDQVILVGNSLGGHIGLYFTKMYPELVKALVITGSSGLYESGMGESYPKRGDYEYIKKKAEDVFYDPKIATKEIVDEVFTTVNDRIKLIKTLTIAKSAIRHNMAKDLPKMTTPTCIIWGRNDKVTPPNVAEEFDKLLPNSELFWIEECGHAAMMEHPNQFNEILYNWFQKKKI